MEMAGGFISWVVLVATVFWSFFLALSLRMAAILSSLALFVWLSSSTSSISFSFRYELGCRAWMSARVTSGGASFTTFASTFFNGGMTLNLRGLLTGFTFSLEAVLGSGLGCVSAR